MYSVSSVREISSSNVFEFEYLERVYFLVIFDFKYLQFAIIRNYSIFATRQERSVIRIFTECLSNVGLVF